jgi:hypothetical protein
MLGGADTDVPHLPMSSKLKPRCSSRRMAVTRIHRLRRKFSMFCCWVTLSRLNCEITVLASEPLLA